MRKLLFFLCIVASSLDAKAQLNLAPYPNEIKIKRDSINLSSYQLIAPENLFFEKNYLEEALLQLNIVQNKDGKLISFETKKSITKEGYEIEISRNKIKIKSGNATGAFYGIQTFLQLVKLNRINGKIPCLIIKDSPSFEWRSMMLDESRYFKGKKVVLKLLDEMASLKLNVFHWHLTDDQGWRIEIKKYPLLTSVGAYRKTSQIGGFKSNEYDGVPHGGFYTQDEIKEIVAYAKTLHILVVPEIEMPGHASAAVASYPWLGSGQGSIEVPGKFGVQYQVYNIADKKVVSFLHDVLKEVFDLFPGNIIHIGGDEVKFDQWKENSDIAEYMKEKGLINYPDVQVDFTNGISAFLEDNGKTMMGWNEIMGKNVHEWQADINAKSTLSKNAIVHFWKGDSLMIKDAVEKGYKIVNSTHNFTYLDYSYETLPLEKAYNFNPIPVVINKKDKNKVIGLGCQMWGEWIPTEEQMNKMVFPRIIAYAEVGWTNQENKNYNRFLKVLPNFLKEVQINKN